MPNIKSAIKRVEVAKRQAVKNTPIKSALRTTIKKFEDAAAHANVEEAKTTLNKAVVSLDKAVTKGILHKNAASRKKSRLTKRLNNLVNNAAQ